MSLEIQELMRQAQRLRILPSRRVEDRLSGEYRSAFKGFGIEFDDVREYAYGDDIRDIDWNVTARLGHPYIKRYHEERELTVILGVDVSGSLSFGVRGRAKSETAAALAGLLTLTADRHHDKTGLLLFSNRIEKYIPPSRGHRHVMRVLHELLTAGSRHRGTDIAAALRFLNRVHTRRATMFLVSDFYDDAYGNDFQACAKRHDLIACRLRDDGERGLPAAGLLEIADPESGATRSIDASESVTRSRLREWADAQARYLEKLCRRHEIDLLELSNQCEVPDALRQWFRQRRQRTRVPRKTRFHGVTQTSE